MLGDLILESLTPSVNAPLYPYFPPLKWCHALLNYEQFASVHAIVCWEWLWESSWIPCVWVLFGYVMAIAT